MAEIPVQPKRGVPGWVWVVAVLIVLAILWFVFGGRSTGAATTTGRAVPAQVAPEPAPRAPAAAFALA